MIFYFLLSLMFWALAYLGLVVAVRSYKILLGKRRPVEARQAVLVTGATSGIGLAVSKHLYKLGYSLIVGYYDSAEPGYEELMQISKQHSSKKQQPQPQQQQRMIFVELDVRSQESISRAYERCASQLDEHRLELYALINNAGLGSLQPFAWLQRSNIKNLIETNLLGSLLMTREFLPLLVKSSQSNNNNNKRQHGARLLNVSSGLGLVPGYSYTTYGITKSAQIYFTRSLNQEFSELRLGVKSIAIIPHNFIKNTNICAHNVKTNESAWNELRPLEQQLYKSSYQKHLKMVIGLEDATKLHAKLASSSQAPAPASTRAYGSETTASTTMKDDCSGDVKGRRRSSSPGRQRSPKQTDLSGSRLIPSSWLGQVMDVIERLKGENVALTLEQSGVLECFESALRLEDPPEHIFAGDNIYNLLIGSFLLSVPGSCLALLARSVSPSLYSSVPVFVLSEATSSSSSWLMIISCRLAAPLQQAR